MDRYDNIWIGFDFGEWGGRLSVFNTRSKESLSAFASLPVHSFFEDSSSVYSSSGLEHMMMVGGSIERYSNFKATTVFNSESYRNPSSEKGKKYMIDGEYIGPATFNPFNNSIYFYSQNGIFKGDITKDLSKKENWDLVVKPTLTWSFGQPKAAGYQMNVLKIIIIDKDRFIFLSQNDGIGYFNGKTLLMLK